MKEYRYILMVRNYALRDDKKELGISLKTNSSMILQKHIKSILDYGNLDFKVLVNDEIEESFDEVE